MSSINVRKIIFSNKVFRNNTLTLTKIDQSRKESKTSNVTIRQKVLRACETTQNCGQQGGEETYSLYRLDLLEKLEVDLKEENKRSGWKSTSKNVKEKAI